MSISKKQKKKLHVIRFPSTRLTISLLQYSISNCEMNISTLLSSQQYKSSFVYDIREPVIREACKVVHDYFSPS